jgi:hypothetical protein
MTVSVSLRRVQHHGKDCKRTQPKLADGTLLRNGLLDDGFVLSTLGFLFLCKGLVGTALLGCLNLRVSVSSCVLLSCCFGDFTIVRCVS